MYWLLPAGWLVFFATFYWSHRKVRRAAGGSPRPERRIRFDRSSDVGMALQFGAVCLALFLPGPWRPALTVPMLTLMVGSIALARAALRRLGRQWRVQAVVTDDHELITDGPYRVVRHPVYLAFFGMVLATILARGYPLGGAAALAAYVAGTEIRVRAEERLLLDSFGPRFTDFVAKCRWAYLPGLR